MNNTPCRECGEPIEDSIGDVYGLCQERWEHECSRNWWHIVEQLAAVAAPAE